LRGLAELQRRRPELRNLTFYYFGDIHPAHYGVVGKTYRIDANFHPEDMPPTLDVGTEYLAVSASLAWGPWGPEGYFRPLEGKRPMLDTDDATIAIYRADVLRHPVGVAGDPGAGWLVRGHRNSLTTVGAPGRALVGWGSV